MFTATPTGWMLMRHILLLLLCPTNLSLPLSEVPKHSTHTNALSLIIRFITNIGGYNTHTKKGVSCQNARKSDGESRGFTRSQQSPESSWSWLKVPPTIQGSLCLLPSSGDGGEQGVATEEGHHTKHHQIFHRLQEGSLLTLSSNQNYKGFISTWNMLSCSQNIA